MLRRVLAVDGGKTIECPMCKASCKVMWGQASSLLKNYSRFD